MCPMDQNSGACGPCARSRRGLPLGHSGRSQQSWSSVTQVFFSLTLIGHRLNASVPGDGGAGSAMTLL